MSISVAKLGIFADSSVAPFAHAGRKEDIAGFFRTFVLFLHPVDTPFQKRVWNALLEIPCVRSNGQTFVNFNLVQMGLGCIDSWGALPREEYLVKPHEMTFNCTLRPVEN